jgi:hypothetical protein
MKKSMVLFSMILIISSAFAQVHIPASKSMVGFWKLSIGLKHGSPETIEMYSVNNPDGTFYMFTISGKDSLKTNMLQYGTYSATSDSTCTEQIVKHCTNSAMNGTKVLIRYRLLNDNTMQWQWKLDYSGWMTEIWSRVN